MVYAQTTSEKAKHLATYHANSGWYTCLCNDSGLGSPQLNMPNGAVEYIKSVRWKTAISHCWAHSSHINILEAHGLLLALRWYTSSCKKFHSRVPILVDSTAIVGAMSKGRSSSTRLQRQCRRIAAICLASDIRPYYVWVSTNHNPADAPSRR